ncbi:hypothetical protein N7537_007216 [Penicillium hordei]|uniref:Uncharacterized protein n=1 Tax=Penicillium hordei TaxID=40994 RepID=A0AAD6E8Y6_9EURO|nr:uncharacterized protein N7537_007216 [Penicillium hordei]KAJ5604260.1 hypothetical protein N7537_007216 [Penicillium hordei]
MEPQESEERNATLDRPWMPWTLRIPFLCSLAGFFLLFAIALEILRQVSERNHGLVIYKTIDEIPKVISGAYIYVPVSMSVLAVTLWQFFVGDALRLEPYFQLARLEGAPATVLFTNYNFSFGVMASVAAARNRHWLIFVISTLSIIFRIFLPSLLSGLVVLTETSVVQSRDVSSWPKLLDQDTQKKWFAAETIRYANTSAMSTTDEFFLSRSSDYATATVSMPLDENETSVLSTHQTVYWSELVCQNVSPKNITWVQQTTTNKETDHDSRNLTQWRATQIKFAAGEKDHPCTINFALNTTTPGQSGPLQLQYWEPLRAQSRLGEDSAFQTSHCESHALLGLLIDINDNHEDATKHSSNATAFVCNAIYRSAEAGLKFDVNASITEATVDFSSQRDLREAEFFHPGFYDLLYRKSRWPLSSRSQTQNDMMESPAKLAPAGLVANLDQEKWIDFLEYQNEIIGFWNNQFIIYLNKFFDANDPISMKASQVTVVVALDVLSKPAIMSEALLFAAATLLFLLAVVYSRRANFLQSDPGSIAAQCAIISKLFTTDNPLTQSSEKFSHATSRQLLRWARNFRCEWADSSGSKRINIVPLSPSMSNRVLELPVARRRTDPRPHFVILPLFLVECTLLTGTLVMYGFALSDLSLKDINNAQSNKQFVLMVFLLCGPTFISSLVSSLLASLVRHLAIIETWGRLQQGMAGIRQSLAKNYGSLLPISILFHNLCQGPLLLTAASILCTLGLVLTIVSGGMFEQQMKLYSQPATGLNAEYNGTMLDSPTADLQFDGVGLMMMSMNRGTPILPWQDATHSFLPLANTNLEANQDSNVNYAAVTVGIGASLRCHQVSFDQSSIENGSGKKSWNYTSPSGLACAVEAPNRAKSGLIKRSISYLEPIDVSAAKTGCQSTVFVLARWETMESSPINSQNSVALSCEPSIGADEFEVAFDQKGIILSSKPTTASAMHGGHTAHNLSLSTVTHFNRAILSTIGSYSPLENASFSHYDWPGMMTVHTYDGLYPSSQLSFHPSSLISATQSTYQQIFSAYLTFNRDLYFERYAESAAPSVEGTALTSLWGLFPSAVSIIIALVLLSLDILIVVFVFATRSSYFRAPRIPASLGSLIPWVAGSEMMADLRAMPLIGKYGSQGAWEQQDDRFYRFGLSPDLNGHKRWLLDYQHSGLQEVGSELTQVPIHDQSSSGQIVGSEAIASPNNSPWSFSGIIQRTVKSARWWAKRSPLPP